MHNPFEDIISRLERIEALLVAQQQKPEPVPPNLYITREEAAIMLSVSLKTLGAWTKEGIIKGYRIGSRVRYKKHEIEASLKQIRTKRI